MDEDLRGSPGGRVKIWWLASYPKSGNTWLRMLLSAYHNGGVVDINRPVGLEVDDLQPTRTQHLSPVPLEELCDGDKLLLRPAMLLHWTLSHDPAQPLLVKTHHANCRVAGTSVIPPTLTHGAVYLVRDPRDVAVSFAEHRRVDVDAVITAMAHREHIMRKPPMQHIVSSWSDHVRSWTKADLPVLVVRYEDMVANTRAALSVILRWLRHPEEPRLMYRAVEAARFEALQAQERAHGFREKAGGDMFFARGGTGGWADVLTDDQVLRIQSDHGPVMREFGYL